MSTRWMAVQYVGDTLRIPVANESDMGMPFGSSTLERDVRRIVVNPFSDSPQVFVPEAENAKLRKLVHRLISHVEDPPCEGCLAEMSCDGEHVTQCDEWLFMVADARELGVEVN